MTPWMGLRSEENWALTFPVSLPAQRTAWLRFIKRIGRTLQRATGVEVVEVPIEEQRLLLGALLDSAPDERWVVIDPCSHGLGGVDWRLTRVFEWDMENKTPAGFLHGPLPNLGGQGYRVVDDDIASGSTMREVERLLGPPSEKIALLSFWAAHTGRSPLDCLDVVDARDFLPGARSAGLMLQLPAGPGRLPYMAPYVNLSRRSIVPPDQIVDVSRELWAHAAEFFSILPPLPLSAGDPDFVTAAGQLGFPLDMPFEEWCLQQGSRL